MTSTQRLERANHMLKNFVNPGCSMNMFVRQYQKLQFGRDADENFVERRCRLKGVLLSSGGPIEVHASKVYTQAMYELFGVARFQAASYSVQGIIHGLLYIVTHMEADKRESWSRVSFKVEVQDDGEYIHCECGMYEHMGMLCCHAIRILMHLEYREIPKRHIMKRWPRHANIFLPDHLLMYQEGSPAMLSTSYRHTALHRTAADLVHLGDSNPESYHVAMNTMLTAMQVLTQTSLVKDGLSVEEREHAKSLSARTQQAETDTEDQASDRNRVRLKANMLLL